MYVIGTAGHVDHGKSTLVQALTGIDPDRLREEKERGMTIDLGFAWLRLPRGLEVSIVDVPGHERFVNNMLAGVGAIDLALLVVAADESVMPQTREHLAILDLLQIRRGLVAVTKADLVDEEWLELVVADVEELLEGTTLEGSPIVPVSAATGQGLDRLVATIEELLERTEPRRDVGRPRLPVDRSFTIAGFGCVVTGTLVDGALEVGQEVEIVPTGRRVRIRGLQTHRQRRERAEPGTRVAANLVGVSHEEVRRGHVLALPGTLRPTTAMDVRLRVIADAPRPLRHNMTVTVHAGSSEAVARLRLLDRETAAPGQRAWAQLKLETPLAVLRGDYFVVRSGGVTLGGGTVVDPHAPRHRRHHAPTLERLEVMEQGSDEDVLLKTLEAGEPLALRELARRANLDLESARRAAAEMASQGRLVALNPQEAPEPATFLYTAEGWERLVQRARRFLESFHRSHPLRRGAPREELRSRLAVPSPVFAAALDRLRRQGQVEEEGALLRLPGHRPALSPRQEEEVRRYLRRLESSPFSPPTDLSLDPEVLNLLAEEGRVVRVSESVVFHPDAYREMVERITAHLREHGHITVAQVRDMFGTSRKYALALMDYLDQQHLTRRTGDVRVLVRQG